MKQYAVTLVLSLLILGGHTRNRGCRRPKGKIGQTAVCEKVGGRGHWKRTVVTPACEPVVSGVNYGEFHTGNDGYDLEVDNTTFQAFNVITDQIDHQTTTTANYWLADNDIVAPVGQFHYDIGCSKSIQGFAIKNTHNFFHNDRGTEYFTISVRNSQADYWTDILKDKLNDVRNIIYPPTQYFNVSTIMTRFVRFEIESYYGSGGGVQFFLPL